MYFLSVLSPRHSSAQRFSEPTSRSACFTNGLSNVATASKGTQKLPLNSATLHSSGIDWRLVNLFIRPFSKYLRDKPIDGISLIEQMDRLAIEEAPGRPFLYATNNDRAQPRPEWSNATPLSVASHGLNTYSDHHAIYCSAALNREPKHYKPLEALGLTAEMIDQSTSHEIIYQAVMRTSLRNPIPRSTF